ncbi:MAG: hypothetical protein NVSMB26_01800 [Beijerinckiaceae bacterium]
MAASAIPNSKRVQRDVQHRSCPRPHSRYRSRYSSPEDDIIAVTTRMADFNPLNLSVVDTNGRIQGIITVDEALEAGIPRDWFQRERGQITPRLRPQAWLGTQRRN